MLEGDAAAPATQAAIRAAGAAYLFAGLACYIVRWNKVNAVAATIGCAAGAATSAYIALSMDAFSFVPRPYTCCQGFSRLASCTSPRTRTRCSRGRR